MELTEEMLEATRELASRMAKAWARRIEALDVSHNDESPRIKGWLPWLLIKDSFDLYMAMELSRLSIKTTKV